jgi:hypothetical protein
MSSNAKKRSEEFVDKDKLERAKRGEIIRKAETKIMSEKQKELEQVLEKQYDNICKQIANNTNGELNLVEVRDWLDRPMSFMQARTKYNAEQLTIVFEYYKKAITEINKVGVFQPTKKNFCSFAGISSITYSNWLKDVDNRDLMEIMQQIDDYITDVDLTLAQQGKIREVTTIFRSKAEHNMIEASAPLTYRVERTVDIENIKAQLDLVNQGKSLKGIELKKQADGTYSAEE